jgi:hypothetical protein
VRVGCVVVTPVSGDWTEYDVRDVDGKVTTAADQHDVYLDSRSSKSREVAANADSARSGRVIVRQGEQKSRSEKCGAADEKSPTEVAGKGAIMNAWAVKGPAIGVIGVAICWALCQSSNPSSPLKP